MKNHIHKNDNFYLMTSGAKNIDIRSKLIENVTWAWSELPNTCFQILSSYHTFEDNREYLRKKTNF